MRIITAFAIVALLYSNAFGASCTIQPGQSQCNFSAGGTNYTITRTLPAIDVTVTPDPPAPGGGSACTDPNKLSAFDHSVRLTLNGSTVSGDGTANHALIRAISGIAPNSGKYYWEWTTAGQGTGSSAVNIVGLQDGNSSWSTAVGNSGIGVGWGYSASGGNIYASGGFGSTGSATAPGNATLGVAYDSATGRVWFRNGTGWISGDPATGTGASRTFSTNPAPILFPAASMYGTQSGTITFNFGPSFTYAPPPGFGQAMLCGPQQGALELRAIIVAGQSNAVNEATGYYAPSRQLLQININDGNLIEAHDPVAGVGSQGGTGTTSFMLPLLDQLNALDLGYRIILAPIAVASTYSADWAAGGSKNGRLTTIASQLAALNIPVAAVLWQQGEGDAGANVSQQTYMANVQSVRQTLVNAGVSAPFFVPLETICATGGATQPQPTIRAAQSALVDNVSFLAGPDFDTISARYDGCHFNQSGTLQAAGMWASVLSSYLTNN